MTVPQLIEKYYKILVRVLNGENEIDLFKPDK